MYIDSYFDRKYCKKNKLLPGPVFSNKDLRCVLLRLTVYRNYKPNIQPFPRKIYRWEKYTFCPWGFQVPYNSSQVGPFSEVWLSMVDIGKYPTIQTIIFLENLLGIEKIINPKMLPFSIMNHKRYTDFSLRSIWISR